MKKMTNKQQQQRQNQQSGGFMGCFARLRNGLGQPGNGNRKAAGGTGMGHGRSRRRGGNRAMR